MRDSAHVPVDCADVGETGENRGQGVVAFGALPMHECRLELLKLLSDRPDATLEKRAHPAEFRHAEAVENDAAR